ncbi:hypothetical protein NPIL_57411 [Nephila pilipes]|uniref:Uncharacterized protein n=1 Tax=Nephila pilipes TaxID=299642 RepID=A0A8X6NFB3_NEPPI|nr:hypothetical protein NPIL_57411 [Nephila pilipes]
MHRARCGVRLRELRQGMLWDSLISKRNIRGATGECHSVTRQRPHIRCAANRNGLFCVLMIITQIEP